jgi:hypothetical protein
MHHAAFGMLYRVVAGLTGGNPMEAVPTLTPRSEAPLLTRQSEAAIPAAVEGVPHATIEG